ncbi:unnamed protein product [Fraxinus pennsylvanica]|uniref:Uncharacterized protein n=1 Tax=Fraxinus pennsylvanica TaxID=56036 RepID=A0AAD1ZVV4_9LAMI|nr:unnamed protein product [Fraxinus pennsylvanica]
MIYFRHFSILISTLFIFSLLSVVKSNESSIYEVLKLHGLPIGLLPKGVKDFTFDSSGNFEVHLDQACTAKFENELHYHRNVSGTLSYGQIDGLSGISAQDLFLWFPVKEIRVDIPSSGLIYFDVGVVSKQFSLSSFETPRDCLAVQLPDLEDGRYIVETVSKFTSEKLRYQPNQDDIARTASLARGLPCSTESALFLFDCDLREEDRSMRFRDEEIDLLNFTFPVLSVYEEQGLAFEWQPAIRTGTDSQDFHDLKQRHDNSDSI